MNIQRRNKHERQSSSLPSYSPRKLVINAKGYKVYWKRWNMLFYMSMLNLLSDWTCYSVAPIASLFNEDYGVNDDKMNNGESKAMNENIHPTILVVIFFLANAFSTACEPIILSRLGLRRTIVLGSSLLTFGSLLKSGIPGLADGLFNDGAYAWRIYMGFFIVGLSQPLYQCTPALLSASWFPENERTLATGVALNSNQIGIGFAFFVGTIMVKEREDIPKYFEFLTIIAILVFFGAFFQFEDAPPTPPSDTAKSMKGTMDIDSILPKNCVGKRILDDVSSVVSTPIEQSKDSSFLTVDTITLSDVQSEVESDYNIRTAYSIPNDNLEPIPILISPNRLQIQIRDDQVFLSAKACLSRPGFVHSLVAFSVSGIVINTLSTYMNFLIVGSSQDVGIIGGSFQVIIMVSSLLVGRLTDRTRAYFGVIILLLVLGGFMLAKCTLCLGGDENDFRINWFWLLVAALVGPLQPVATELGVDVAYPLSENTVLVILQLFSNMLSAIFIPIFGWFRGYGNGNIEVDDDELNGQIVVNRPEYFVPLYLMILLHACATVFFATFNGRYMRLEHENKRKDVETSTNPTSSVRGEQQPLLGGPF